MGNQYTFLNSFWFTLGCTIAAVFAILEFLYGTKQSAKDAGVTWLEEMTNELRFIFQCHGNTKELRTKDSEADSDVGSHSSQLRKSRISVGAESNYMTRAPL